MSIGSTTLAGGTFSLGINAVTFTGNFTHAAGNTFTAGTGSVILSGNAVTYTGNTTFYDLTEQAGNAAFSATISAGTTFTVTNSAHFVLGYLNSGTISLGAGATVFASSTTTTFGTSLLTFGQIGNETIQCDANGKLPVALLVNKPSGSLSYNCSNFSIGSTTIQSGTFSMGSNNLTLQGNFTHNPGATFDTGTGNVTLATNASTYTGNSTFYDLTMGMGNAAFSANIAAATTFTVSHSFHYVLGYLQTGTISMGAGATVFASSTNTNMGSTLLSLAQTGNDTIQCDSGALLLPMLVNKPSGTLSYTCPSLSVGSTTVQSGTFSVGSNTLTILGNANLTGGTLDGGTGTVVFKGSFSTYTGNFSLYKVDISANTTGITNTIAQGSSITAANTLRFVEGLLNTGTTTAQGDVTVLSTYDGGNSPLVFSGSATQAFTLTGATGLYDGSITVNKTGGQVNLASALVMDASSQNLTLTSGKFNLNGNNLTVSGTGGTFVVQNGGTFALNGGETTKIPTLAASSTVEYNGTGSYSTLQAGSAYANLAFTGSGSWATTTALTIGGGLNQTAGTFTASGVTFSSTTASAVATTSAGTTITNLTLNKSGQTLSLAGSGLTLSGNLTLTAGTLDASVSGCSSASCPITVAGNWVGGSNLFVPRTSTVTLNGTNQQITGTNTFYNLSKTVSSADTLTWGASQTQTVTNTWAMHGAASNLLSFVSSSPSTQWNIDPQGTRTLSYLSVQDSNNINGTIVSAGGLNITDNSRNTNWSFLLAAPVVSPVTISSNNSSTTLAKAGDVVTVSFTTDQTPLVAPTGTIGTHTATMLHGSGNSWTASTTLSSSDSTGIVAFSFSVGNADASATTTITSITSGANVAFDKTAPTITLLGSNPDTVVQNNTYADPGATASDSHDGVLTSSIQTSGSVVVTTPGTYTLTYSVSDAAGNATSTTRSVTVTAAPVSPTPVPSGGNGMVVDSGPLAPSSRAHYGISSTAPTASPASPIVPAFTTPENPLEQFTRTLKIGSQGLDVKRLQAILNAKGYIVAKSGPGSSGQETTLFGSLTKAALIRFQNAHAESILIPNNLTSGTGIFGISTMAFINKSISK